MQQAIEKSGRVLIDDEQLVRRYRLRRERREKPPQRIDPPYGRDDDGETHAPLRRRAAPKETSSRMGREAKCSHASARGNGNHARSRAFGASCRPR